MFVRSMNGFRAAVRFEKRTQWPFQVEHIHVQVRIHISERSDSTPRLDWKPWKERLKIGRFSGKIGRAQAAMGGTTISKKR